ncbi:DUF2953 domain-containing protein [Desulfoscipio gibsoniae]|uniref:DUF2953 domain-containing protein n=1 Tax=Desulfoscipio gibsoniae DSM 7213 TaxID=767817 RepID=R4KH72_9FIRM|nr:DUF2953 domain-containing protein [Desulfoscipio gibsoniae]AGL01964.1 Protein of unknown function (DUF2953) [Desulfoscipio gibsoniae DSM 7213]
MWYLTILAPVLILLLLLLVSPVTVHISYALKENDDSEPNTTLNLSTPGTGVSLSFMWGLFKLRLRLSSIKLVYGTFAPVFKLRARLARRSGSVIDREKTSISASRIIDMYKQIVNIYRATEPAYRYMLSATKLHQFSWCTRLGMYQADQTGMAVGLLWIAKSNTAAYLYRLLKKPSPKPELEIIPVFNARLVATRINCVFSLRSVNMVITCLMAAWLYLKNKEKKFGA